MHSIRFWLFAKGGKITKTFTTTVITDDINKISRMLRMRYPDYDGAHISSIDEKPVRCTFSWIKIGERHVA